MEITASRIDAATLMRIKSLELRARRILDGYMQGLHRSPYHGSSVEFSEYRAYTVGDDPRHIDWKLYARTDRYCIKKFEAETNLYCHLAVDLSRSMGFKSLSYSKADYAATLAATFAQFLFSQGDSVGLVTFDDKIQSFVPALRRRGHLHEIMVGLERQPTSPRTDLKKSLSDLGSLLKKKGLIILISDLLGPAEAVTSELAFLRSCGHDVAVFHLLDPAERNWTFEETARFEDMETGQTIELDPGAAKQAYLEKLTAHCAVLERACKGMAIDWIEVTSDQDFAQSLHELLSLRSRVNRQRRQ